MSETRLNEWHQVHVDAAMADPECEDCYFRDPSGATQPSVERLDVERLARALHAATQALGYIDLGMMDVHFGGQPPFTRVAKAIVDADARLPEGSTDG